MILIVVATDQLIWRPLIAWSDKFKFEQVESAERVTSPILELLRRSNILQFAFRPHLCAPRRAHLSAPGKEQGVPHRAGP